MNLTFELKEPKTEHDSYLEVVRLKDGKYHFDEVAIKRFNQTGFGVEIVFVYQRNGVRVTDLDPVVVSAADFAEARSKAKDKYEFAQSRLVQRLFAEGARQYHARGVRAKEDFLEDMNFIESLMSDAPKE